MICDQKGCESPAAFRFTWPGENEAGICTRHLPQLRAVADKLGFLLHPLIALETAEPLPEPQAATMIAIRAEVIRARLQHPGRTKMLAALVEEVGELAKAILEEQDRDCIEVEAIQVACMAIRILEEGDESHSLPPLASMR